MLASDSMNSVSVTGPTKSGRSSILQQLSDRAHLALFKGLGDATVIQADFSEFRGEAASAIRYLIESIAKQLDADGAESKSVRACLTVRAAVRQALRSVPGRLILVVDNFEAVGSDLRKDDQADLRASVYKEPRAAFVVASRLPLSRCLEEFGDALSDFGPTCFHLPRALSPLTEGDVAELIEHSGTVGEREGAAPLAKAVFGSVGGYALWVQQALALVFRPGTNPGAPGFFDEAQRLLSSELLERIGPDLEYSYRKLSASSQRFIVEAAVGEPMDGSDQLELELSGWSRPGEKEFQPSCSVVKEWIYARHWEFAGRRGGASDRDTYERLVSAVEHLNLRHQRHTRRKTESVIRPDVFHSSTDIAYLRRRVLSEDDFGRRVLSLARLVYEGSGGGVKGAKLRLPLACYERLESVVFQVARLRHAFVHLEHPEEAAAERNLRDEAAIFQRHLGVPDPRTIDEYRMVGDALVELAIQQVEALTDLCPFSPDLCPPFLYAG